MTKAQTFQTRNGCGELRTFRTLKEAFEANKRDNSIWKISTDGVRLIKHYKQDGSACWLNRPIEDYIKKNLPPPSQGEIEGLDY